MKMKLIKLEIKNKTKMKKNLIMSSHVQFAYLNNVN